MHFGSQVGARVLMYVHSAPAYSHCSVYCRDFGLHQYYLQPVLASRTLCLWTWKPSKVLTQLLTRATLFECKNEFCSSSRSIISLGPPVADADEILHHPHPIVHVVLLRHDVALPVDRPLSASTAATTPHFRPSTLSIRPPRLEYHRKRWPAQLDTEFAGHF